MSESQGKSGPQFQADGSLESGQRLGPIPRGVEVLVRKASVDPEFKRLLLVERSVAARRIDLALDQAEAMMLDAVPEDQLEAIIARTTVPNEHRRAFLGTAAAAMLAAVGLISAGCNARDPSLDKQGRPTRNRAGDTGGAAPDEPPEKAPDGNAGSAEPSAEGPAEGPSDAP